MPLYQDAFLQRIILITTTGSLQDYVPTAGTVSFEVQLQAAGGGGGGAVGSATNFAAASGGQGGSLVIKTVVTPDSLYKFSVGVGGTAGGTTGTNGGLAGDTIMYQSDGITEIARSKGGGGGIGDPGSATAHLTIPGTTLINSSSGGDVHLTTVSGDAGLALSSVGSGLVGGKGGDAAHGGGGAPTQILGNGGTGLKGGGGSGATANSTTGHSGGVGGDGYVVIYEYGTA